MNDIIQKPSSNIVVDHAESNRATDRVMNLTKKLFTTKKGLMTLLILAALVIGVIAYTNSNNKQNHSQQYARHGLSARVTWTEQSFNEWFFGNGIMQQRRYFTADGRSPETQRSLENYKLLGTWSNYTSVNQQGNYSYQEKYGHSVSASAKARAKWLEVEVRYTFNYEQVYTYSTTVTIPPQKRIEVSQYDIRVKYQYLDVKVQKQTAKLFGGWKDNDWWWEDEVIKEYAGRQVNINEYNA